MWTSNSELGRGGQCGNWKSCILSVNGGRAARWRETFDLLSYFVSAVQSALPHHAALPLTDKLPWKKTCGPTHTQRRFYNRHTHTNTPARTFKAIIALTLSRVFSTNILVSTFLYVCSLALFVCVFVSSRPGHWLQTSQTSWNTDIRATQKSALGPKITQNPFAKKKAERLIRSHQFTLVERPSGGRCGCWGCHGDHSRGEGLPWGGERLAAAPLSHRVAPTAALLVLYVNHRLPSICSQGIFGAANGKGRWHLLEVGTGKTGGAVIEPLLRGTWESGNPTAWASAVVGLVNMSVDWQAENTNQLAPEGMGENGNVSRSSKNIKLKASNSYLERGKMPTNQCSDSVTITYFTKAQWSIWAQAAFLIFHKCETRQTRLLSLCLESWYLEGPGRATCPSSSCVLVCVFLAPCVSAHRE